MLFRSQVRASSFPPEILADLSLGLVRRRSRWSHRRPQVWSGYRVRNVCVSAPLLRRLDVADWLVAGGFAAISYPVFRYLELKYVGR